ncbi:GTPase [uncultured Psychromonas sp.]|uniref:GTPase family protein n=1 Tax=uncultured Psychromonas sp. TaxID=173974 RepID=UPI0026075008|nr:GTPase [uncultured Psychromonas sp.]
MTVNNFNSENYRLTEIKENLDKMGVYPLDVMITGVTGAGKSTTLNTLFNKEVASVGLGCDPMTMNLDAYNLHGQLRLWDTPGLGDGINQDKIHSKKLIDLLHKTYVSSSKTHGFIDMVIIVIEGSNRDMGTTFQLIIDVILENIEPERVVIAINKADMAKKGRGWDSQNNEPTQGLEDFLEAQAEAIKIRIKASCGIDIKKPVYYSADNHYNIQSFMDAIIDAMPLSRRNLLLHSA